MDKVIAPSKYPGDLVVHQKKDIKDGWVPLDSMMDHLIPHSSENNMTKEMFDSLVGLFHRTNMNRKMVLRNKLILVKMSRYDSVTNYLMRITQVHPTLPFENEVKVVDPIPPLVDPTPPLKSEDVPQVFLVSTDSSGQGVTSSVPKEPPLSNEAILLYWGALSESRLPSYVPFQITI